MIADAPTVHLSLESRPQTLTLVRGMLSGMAEPLGIEAELLDDLKTAVSEACNNVVIHAYGDDVGPMDVRMFADADRLTVAVEDQGDGVTESELDPGRGIGLSVIRALTESTEVQRGDHGGTLIEMVFGASRAGQSLFAPPRPAAPDPSPGTASGEEVFFSVSPVNLLAAVLGRMARTLAATAHFSLDRFSDVYLITDTLAAQARQSAAPRVWARLNGGERRLEIEVGPFARGSCDALTEPSSVPSPLALLSDELTVAPDGDDDRLRVVVMDRRQ